MTLRANYPHCPEPQQADRVERQIVTLSAGRRQVCTQAMTDLGLLCGRPATELLVTPGALSCDGNGHLPTFRYL